MEHKVYFHGKAGEYFGIWIVNILLSIVTLGIYSAWAKVRTQRYFYGNTVIDGHSFEYHATGKQILIGRIIVVGALLLYSILAQLAPLAALVLFVVYLGVFPELIVRGLRFSRRVSSYRNVRFDFTGSYGEAFWALILLPILNVFTLYTITPLVSRRIAEFVVDNSRYGNRSFSLDDMPVGPLYVVLAIALTTFILLGFMTSLFSGFGFRPTAANLNSGFNPMFFIALAIFYLVVFVAFQSYNAVLRNLRYNHTVLDNRHEFTSNIDTFDYCWLILSNAVVTIATLGLMAPWAKVRTARFLSEHTTFISSGSLDDYASSVTADSGVVGAEFMDIEGVDVGAGL